MFPTPSPLLPLGQHKSPSPISLTQRLVTYTIVLPKLRGHRNDNRNFHRKGQVNQVRGHLAHIRLVPSSAHVYWNTADSNFSSLIKI